MTHSLAIEFPQLARPLVEHVNEALDRYSRFGDGCPAKLEEAVRHSLLAPGKRLRPLLVLMSAQACGCPKERALPAACAVEMVHAYSLIHDDLPAMDDDDLRRGRPSCHAAFGEATAILAGDALLARALEVLAHDTKPPAVAARCTAELARAAGATALVGGQADDLEAENLQGDLALLEAIHRRKTGALFRVSLRLGGLIAEANAQTLAALETYGDTLGLAFQIIDDLLDESGDPEQVGKSVGKDAAHGKLTFLSLLGRTESRRRAERLIEEACAAVAPLGANANGLEALARYVIERNR